MSKNGHPKHPIYIIYHISCRATSESYSFLTIGAIKRDSSPSPNQPRFCRRVFPSQSTFILRNNDEK